MALAVLDMEEAELPPPPCPGLKLVGLLGLACPTLLGWALLGLALLRLALSPVSRSEPLGLELGPLAALLRLALSPVS